jgi:hypothetical protein
MEPSSESLTPESIAESALAYWDMYAEDTATEEELNETVAQELVALGLEQAEAERVVKMMSAVLADSSKDESIAKHPHTFHGDPIYVALVMFIKTNVDL